MSIEPILALVIDDSLIAALQAWWPTIATAASAIGLAIGGAVWRGYSQLKAFLGPLVKGLFQKHNDGLDAGIKLATEMQAQVPVVAETMKSLADSQAKLVETQVQQCDTLKQLSDASERHEELHAQTGKKLDTILGHLSNREMDTKR